MLSRCPSVGDPARLIHRRQHSSGPGSCRSGGGGCRAAVGGAMPAYACKVLIAWADRRSPGPCHVQNRMQLLYLLRQRLDAVVEIPVHFRITLSLSSAS